MAKYVRQSKEEIRRKKSKRILLITVTSLLILTVAVLFFRQRVREEFASGNQEEVQTAQVTVGSIQTTVSGSGKLASEGVLDVELPIKVSLEDTLAEAGDPVEKGQMLATINVSTALSALKELQEELDALDDEIQAAGDDAASAYIYAGVSGRVKAILVEEGDDVSAAVAEHGALILLSLDGYMAVDIPVGSLALNDSVEVSDSSGEIFEGFVSEIKDGLATVLLTDNGPIYQDTVSIGSESGRLYIHKPLKVTGYAGTVYRINTSENSSVSSYSALLTLENTAYSAGYEQLLAERGEMEELYQALVRMVQDGSIRAEVSGSIQSVAEADDSIDPDDYTVLDSQVLMTLDPNEKVSVSISVDESKIQSLDVGQEASVSVEAIGDDMFTGVVSEIDKTASSSGGVTMYTATITLDKSENMLSGMTADVAITIEGVENALLVPEDAVRKTSATSYVYTSYDEESGELGGMVEVSTGLSNGSYIEIISGLKEGDTVYYTEKEEVFAFGSFNFGGSGMPGGGGMSSGGAMGMPSGGMPGGMPSGGGRPSGSGMPNGFPG